MAFVVKTYASDPPGRPELRRLVRWFFAAHARGALAGAIERDRERWRAAVDELVGGVVGLLGTYGRSRRRSARLRARWPALPSVERP
ncbi:MAG: hypothetical protein ACR2HP_08265 [Ilumatobacteraceae bacterium]